MATEEGIVFKLGAPGSGTAWVKTSRTSACKSCSSRHACQSGSAGKDMEVEAINSADAKVGDRIVLNIKTTTLLKATFLLYIFPVLAMIAGAFIGQAVGIRRAVGDPSGMSALFAFLFFGLAFLVIRVTGRRMSKNTDYTPEIIKVRGNRPAVVETVELPEVKR